MQQSVFSYQKNLKKMNTRHPVEKKPCVVFSVMVLIAGLVLAGSDGTLMPYLNFGGAIIFMGASVRLGKILPCLEPDGKGKENSRETVRHPMPALVRLVFCSHDDGCA